LYYSVCEKYMTVGALVKRSFITKEVLFQSFTFEVKTVSPYILSIYKTVLLSLEGKFWATIIHSVPAGTRNTDLKSSIKVKPTMGFSIWRNIKWNRCRFWNILHEEPKGNWKEKWKTWQMFRPNFLSRNKHFISDITIEREWRPQIYIWKITIKNSGS
jgi:hypothetical protein